MLCPSLRLTRLRFAVLLCLLLTGAAARAQQPQATPPEQPEDVLRIDTALVQTDVMVFDKSGRFVDNLQRDQFELRVDGKPQPISFFDRITSGSASEEAQLAAARGTPRPSAEKQEPSVGLQDRGRVIVFFIDDLHLAFDSLKRTQQTLLHFVNDEMGQNDQVALAAASGQIGFLQQLTDNKIVLRTAIERLKLQPQLQSDNQYPPMSEYLALEMTARHNQDVLNYFTEPLIKMGTPPSIAEQIVITRAQFILRQSHAFTFNTFYALDNLARTIAPLPGRKLVFFISDGFLLNTNETDLYDKLHEITNTAARNSVVIYTMDARGLSVNSTFDASTTGNFDPTGRISTVTLGENSASQESLRALAGSTGGRALLNTNALGAAITRTLKETATYYVIAWRPETDEQKDRKLQHIEVKIKGRTDLVVQVRREVVTGPAKEAAAKPASVAVTAGSKQKTPAEELRAAIGSFYTSRALPTALALDYYDSPQEGALLSISMAVPASALSFDTIEGKLKTTLDVEGFVYNDQGKSGASFQDRLSVAVDSPEIARQRDRDVFYTFRVRLAPGLYQVRVAARDAKSGHIGSAAQWIEIPNLKTKSLALSSIITGELPATATAGTDVKTSEAQTDVKLNVARRFASSSRLRFLTFIYNAAGAAAGAELADVAIQVQVLRDDQPVVSTPLHKIPTQGLSDPARIPYAAEIPLDNLRAGRYLLQVTAIDRRTKTSASQQLRFEIE